MENFSVIKKELESASDLKEVDDIYKKYLGRKGQLTLALREIGNLPEGERRKRAPKLQKLKHDIEEAVKGRLEFVKRDVIREQLKKESIDVTVPGSKAERGHLHPLTLIQDKVNEIFSSLGFEVVEGPEIETEWYNFDALNIPADHPARDLWDTFWLKPGRTRMLLRTHTSPVQVRYMEKKHPPFRIVAPGRVFRHEASDASHDLQFYQLEGLMVDKDISVGNFKAVINEFLRALYGEDVKIRLRPGFFPFVEPGFEVDMSCTNCSGKGFILSEPSTKLRPRRSESKGCSVCSRTGWLEMMGAGMVHPNVFKAAGYNPKLWQGFAFGIGIDRIAMMKYKIDDIRLFYSGDLRFLKQF